VHREDFVEALAAEVEVLEPAQADLRAAGLDVLAVALGRGVDHLARAVDRHDPAGGQPLADQRHGHAVAAADLQDAVAGLRGEGVDHSHESFGCLHPHPLSCA
jgi:hypothetical protein